MVIATIAVRPSNLQTSVCEYLTLAAECDGRLIPTLNFHENCLFLLFPCGKKYYRQNKPICIIESGLCTYNTIYI